jgi:hypothetical protein
MPARSRARAVVCVLVSIFVVAGCGFGFGRPGYGDSVNGIGCDKGDNVSFRATVHLWLVKKDGQREGPTGRVGSSGSACNYWVQTQDDEGVIHILAPYPVTPKLITFFMIWDYAIPAGSGNSGPFRDASERGRSSSTALWWKVGRRGSSWSTARRSSCSSPIPTPRRSFPASRPPPVARPGPPRDLGGRGSNSRSRN